MSAVKRYVVGGAVRDRLLGRTVQDRDWVVVGATPAQMLAEGFKPVGKDFPVFLHPRTHEEYALARTERKTAPGYKGFVFHTDTTVTLEEDLIRRDLTINAIAEDKDGSLIDPFGGQQDLAARIFRHVSPAFAEDPVRILRLARFAARFPDFSVAPETMEMMRGMVAAGEVDHLVAERVWQEISRGLMCEKPSRMLEVLRECGALARILPEVDALYGVPQPPEYHPEVDTGVHIQLVVDQSAHRDYPLPVRTAALLHDLGKGLTPRAIWPHHYGHAETGVPLVDAVCERLRAPVECRDIAIITCREHSILHDIDHLRPTTVVKLLERLDVMRRPQRLVMMLQACACDFFGRPGFDSREYLAARLLPKAAEAFRAVDAGAIARSLDDKSQIPERVHEARVAAVREALAP